MLSALRWVGCSPGIRRTINVRLLHHTGPQADERPAKRRSSKAKRALIRTTEAISDARRQLDWQRALFIYASYIMEHSHSPEEYAIEMPLINTSISACEIGACWPTALILAERAHELHLNPTAFTLSALMSACRRGRQWQKALEVYHGAGPKGVAIDPTLLGTAITCATTGHLWKHALDILASAVHQSIKPTLAIENAAILACEKGRQWAMALSYFEDMKFRKVSLTTANSVLSACEKAREWQHALCVFDGLPTLSLQPDTISMNLVIGSFAASRHWEDAFELFHCLCRLNEATHVSHTTVLSSCERAMRWEEALQLIRMWPWNKQSFEVAAIAAARAGRWQDSLVLVQGVFGEQQLIQSCEQSGCWGRSSWPRLWHSARLVEALRRWKVDLPGPAGTAPHGVGKHIKILTHPGTAPSNAIWCLTARDCLQNAAMTR
ncbi:unnamed protein product [Durusdinium trenchii]|uniref:Chloroplastic (Protein MATURATION OF RBCL 1) (AtMRL1) n=2 Tax=Durusdinium trenchii TaxID=1381693 RepID=A0ABP0MM30_9DINO